jgi:hypothetical protein
MNNDTRSGRPANGGPRRPRRELLAGAAGALGVIAAETVARAGPAQAANGDPVLQGADNGPTTSRTMVFTAHDTEFASICDVNSHGKGSVGVLGHGTTAGVYGEGDVSGVQGVAFVGTGVFGQGGGGSGNGVVGNGSGNGDGVQGSGSGIGSGVFGRGGAQGTDIENTGAGCERERWWQRPRRLRPGRPRQRPRRGW